MFSELISQLKKGTLPDPTSLKKRFDAALIKKIGVLRQPYMLWSADQKINPSAKHLLWAAILLENHENFKLIEGIIATEELERQKKTAQPVETIIQSHLDELQSLSLSVDLTDTLQKKLTAPVKIHQKSFSKSLCARA